MKFLILLFFLAVSLVTFPQSNIGIIVYADTDIIRNAVDYINTSEFKKILKDTITIGLEKMSKDTILLPLDSIFELSVPKKKPQELLNHVSFLLDEKNCLIPKTYYCKNDPYHYGDFDTFLLGTTYKVSGSKKCFNAYIFTPIFSGDHILELQLNISNTTYSGEVYTFRFRYSRFKPVLFLSFENYEYVGDPLPDRFSKFIN